MLSLFRFASFWSLSFHRSRGPSFNRPSICRRLNSHTCYFPPPPFVYLEMSLFPSIFGYHSRFLYVWRVRRTVLSFRIVFFYLVTTGWIFYISFCENSINQLIINTLLYRAGTTADWAVRLKTPQSWRGEKTHPFDCCFSQ